MNLDKDKDNNKKYMKGIDNKTLKKYYLFTSSTIALLGFQQYLLNYADLALQRMNSLSLT